MQLISEVSFSNIINNTVDKVSLFLFGASWCMPCKQLAPMIDQIKDEYNGKIDFYKLDIEESADLTSSLNIKSVPTILLYKNGELICTKVGSFTTKVALQSFLREYC